MKELDAVRAKIEFDREKVLEYYKPLNLGHVRRYAVEMAKWQHAQLQPTIERLIQVIQLQDEALEFYSDAGNYTWDKEGKFISTAYEDNKVQISAKETQSEVRTLLQGLVE